ncbi:MAG TPA: family 1 glycosylhydrolase [Bacteriovoracaceae bacterium]|nr:family 1 glycosylhydrolase [Bacteriovoracaceae bacterium]
MKPKNSFLDIIKFELGDAEMDGDKFGGADGNTGKGLPKFSESNFMFATGIECSYPVTDDGRRDLMEECGHYEHWKKDLSLVSGLGLRVLRYGLPYHKINTARGVYDWSFADQVMAEMQRLEIRPILDLLHFGVPDWVGDFQNPELPILFAEYVEAVVKRYPWVRYFTPVNEIFVTAKFSAKDGIWNERLKSDRAFVTALKHCVAASILATHVIARNVNNCIIVQSESAEYVHELTSARTPKIILNNKLRFLALDLLYAHHPDADVMLYLLDNGLTREEYDWFMKGEPPGFQVMGNDYYGRNERMLLPDGTMKEAEDVLGWYLITLDYFERYKKPVMHTETNHFDPDEAASWIWKQWCNIMRMRETGVPVLGFTWYSLLDQLDWDDQLKTKKGSVNKCGLYDLNRKERAVAKEYKALLQEFGQMKIVPHGEMFDVTSDAANLKVDL